MMDNYIKRLESVISPNSYNLNNYKEKILDKKATNNKPDPPTQYQNYNGYSNFNFTNSNFGNVTNGTNANLNSMGTFLGNKANIMTFNANSNNNNNNLLNNLNHNIINDDNNINNFNNNSHNINLSNIPNLNTNSNTVEFQLNLDKNNLHSEENKKLIEEYIQRMGIKDLLESASSNPNIINESKMRIYQKILEREGKLENPEDILNSYAEQEILYAQNLNDLNSHGQQQYLDNNNENNMNINNINNSSDFLNAANSTNKFIPNLLQNSNLNSISNNQNKNSNNNNNFNNSKQNFNSISNHNHNASMTNNSRKGLDLHNLNNQNTLNASKNLSVSPSHKYKQLSCGSGENVSTEREKIHMLNIKAMNYRHEVETLKKRINELNKVIEDQKEKILRIEKQKESDNKYLIKLENLLAAQSTGQPSLNAFLNNSANLNNVSSLSNLSQRNFTNGIYVELRKCTNLIVKDKNNNFSLNLTDQAEMKEFVLNLMNEAQKLKAFQKQVFEISKNYDDINENMINSIKTIQNIMDISSAKNIDDIEKKEIYSNFEKISDNVSKTLELKQNEFNFLLDAKDQEIKLLSEEVFKLNENMEQIKRDRIRDQKLLDDYETQNNFLSIRIKEINDKFIDGLGLQVAQKERESQQFSMMMEKNVAPIKQSLNNTAKKIENMFDMQDKSNVKLLSSINKNIK